VFDRAVAGERIPAGTVLPFVFAGGLLLGVFAAFAVEATARRLGRAPAGVPTGRMGRFALGQLATAAREYLGTWPVRIAAVAGGLLVLVPVGPEAPLGGRRTGLLLLCLWAAVLVQSTLLYPAAPKTAVSPEGLLTGDRSTALLAAAVVGPVIGAFTAVTLGGGTGTGTGTGVALVAGAGGWLASAALTLERSAWGRWLVAKARLAVAGELPWSTMAFLRDARRCGVLRRTAGVYQFRHARLREHLAASAMSRPTTLVRDGEELRASAWTGKTVGTLLRQRFRASLVALDAAFSAVAWYAGAGMPLVLAANALYLLGAAALVAYLHRVAPRRRSELRITPDVLEGGTARQPFRYRADEVAEVAVRPLRIRVLGAWRTGDAYAVHVRLRPGVAPAGGHARTSPDAWIPLWITGSTPDVRPELAAALSRFARGHRRPAPSPPSAAPSAPPAPPGLRWDGGELHVTGAVRPPVGSLLRRILPPGLVALDAAALAVAWHVGFGLGALLAVDGALLVGVAALCVYFRVRVPQRKSRLRITADVVEGETAQQPFRYRNGDVAEVTVRPLRVRLHKRWRPSSRYAVHVRLRPGVAPADQHAGTSPDDCFPLWATGETPDVHPVLSEALSRCFGERWRPDA